MNERAPAPRCSNGPRAARLPRRLASAGAAALALVVCAGGPALLARAANAELPRSCRFTAVEETAASLRGLARLVFRVLYPAGELEFGDPVACTIHPKQSGATGVFDDDPAAGVLQIGLEREAGLFPDPLVVCTPRGTETAGSAELTVEVLEAADAGGAPLDPEAAVAVEAFECTTSTTTTTVTTSTITPPTTTTTTPPPAGCGDADASGQVTATDALIVLRKAVGGAVVCPPDRCDTDADGSVNASDALRVLRAAVGLGEPLTCGA